VLRREDASPPVPPRPDAIELAALLQQLELEDPLPTDSPHTWKNGHTSRRLDRPYFTLHSSLNVVPRLLNNPNLSDHHPTTFDIISEDSLPPSPHWKLRPHILSNTHFLNAVADVVSLHKSRDRPLEALEVVKKQIQRVAKSLRTGSQPLTEINPHTDVASFLLTATDQRAAHMQALADTFGEIPSSFLTHRLQEQRRSTIVPPLSNTILSSTDIAEAFAASYRDLYHKKPTSPNDLINYTHLPIPDLQDALSQPISMKELNEALKRTKRSSAPGDDGLPYSLYIASLPLRAMLLVAFNSALQGHSLPDSWKQSIIKPLLKEGKDPTNPLNYRPISLLNCDFKLLTSIINKRLQNALPDYFPLHQTGFVKGRSTHMAILRLSNWVRTEQNGITCLLDFEKAYDNVSHDWLLSVLRKMRINLSIITLITNSLSNCTARVLVNNTFSAPLSIETGV